MIPKDCIAAIFRVFAAGMALQLNRAHVHRQRGAGLPERSVRLVLVLCPVVQLLAEGLADTDDLRDPLKKNVIDRSSWFHLPEPANFRVDEAHQVMIALRLLQVTTFRVRAPEGLVPRPVLARSGIVKKLNECN
jgi:hypothetical protein